jgi:hypothetical protein
VLSPTQPTDTAVNRAPRAQRLTRRKRPDDVGSGLTSGSRRTTPSQSKSPGWQDRV